MPRHQGAIDSVTDNIAEGFGRYDHKEFAHFVKIAKASLGETQSRVLDARSRHYVTDSLFNELWAAAAEAMASVVGLYRYLSTHPTPPGPCGAPRRERG